MDESNRTKGLNACTTRAVCRIRIDLVRNHACKLVARERQRKRANMYVLIETSSDHDYRGDDWNSERTFSAFSLYFFSFSLFCFFCFSGSSAEGIGLVLSPGFCPFVPGLSPFPDWPDDKLLFPIDIVDSLDRNDGYEAAVDCDCEGVSILVLDAAVIEKFVGIEDVVFVLPLDLLENVDGGDFARKNCLGCFRKLSPGFRPRCLVDRFDESAVPPAPASSEAPENDRGAERCDGVDAFLKTAKRYRSTTPLAKRLVPFAPLRSSP